MFTKLKKVTDSPLLRFIIGCMVVLIGIGESDGLIDEIMAGNFHTHHGIMLLGFGQAIQAFPDMFTGLEYITSTKS